MKLTQRARDGIWMLVYKDSGGNRKRVSTGSRDRAEAERQSHLIIAGQGPRAPGHTLSDAMDHAWRRRWKDQKGQLQFAFVMRKVKDDLGKTQCRDITYTFLEQYVEKCEKGGLAASTINHRLSAVSVALKLAHNANRIAAVPPMPRLGADNKRIRWLDHDEEAELLRCARGLEGDGKAYVMTRFIVVLLDTGARLSEITVTHPRDITEAGELRLLDTKSERGIIKNRTVPLTKRALTSLRELHQHDKWKQITRGARTSDVRKASARDWLIKQFTRIRNDAVLPDVSLHVLRHTCASRLVQGGVDLYKVKAWLGHSSITMTERYAHLAPSSLTSLVDVLEPAPVAEVVNINDRRNA